MTEKMMNTATVNSQSDATVSGTPSGMFSFKDGNTTIVVGLHFQQKGRMTLEDKVKRLILDEVKANNS
jgi:hypothetical protein